MNKAEEIELILATVLPEDAPPFPDAPGEVPDQSPASLDVDDEVVDDPNDLIPDDEEIA